jgi:hypothetical protein
MFSELAIAIDEVEQSCVMGDITRAYSDLKSAYDTGKINRLNYAGAKYELDDISDDYDVESIYYVIDRVYKTIDYVESFGNPLEKCVWAEPAICAMTPTMNIAMKTPDLDDSEHESDNEDGFRVILHRNKKNKKTNKKNKNNRCVEPVAEVTLTYDISHSTDIPRDVFFHNMTTAITRFCTNYGCTFDGYTIKYAYCNIGFTHIVKEVGSKKLRYGCQIGVVTLEYKYSSADLTKNTKEVNAAVELALAELRNGLDMYAKCAYLCSY